MNIGIFCFASVRKEYVKYKVEYEFIWLLFVLSILNKFILGLVF